ncbi:MAG: ABC transporter ATP-binding protein [Anaerolineales bacterium]|nr:ABC transporter ATP-binding protein [Anaerolineales bacterium]
MKSSPRTTRSPSIVKSSVDWSTYRPGPGSEDSVTNREPRSLLEISGLKTYFHTEDGVVKAVDGVDISVNAGQILGIVGESGCGKTVTALSIMRLVRAPGRIIAGDIRLDGENLLTLSDESMRKVRGQRISMIFQQPQSSLNPVITIGDQLAEVFQIHTDRDKSTRWANSVQLLKQVGIPDPEKKAYAYPHELSGGQAQRVMIAMALAMKPEMLIADEPTTALDVTIQAQILDLIRDLRNQLGTAVVLITHDLGIVAETADQVVVMYAGRIVEQAGVAELFEHPKHPYTLGLIDSIPILGERKARLDVIPGVVPNLINLPPGCRFAPRCRARQHYELEICTQSEPELLPLADQQEAGSHSVRCWLYQDQSDKKS